MPESRTKWALGALLLAGSVAAGWKLRGVFPEPAGTPAAPVVSAAPPRRDAVGCLGRFKPEDELVRVAAPYYESRPSVIAQLAVKEGDWVRAGQEIAQLDGKAQVEAQRSRALAQIELSRSRVAQVQAGAKNSEIEAQRAELSRLEAAHRLEQAQVKRTEALFTTHDLPASELDVRRAALETAGRAVEQARHRLAALNEVRQQDVRVAEAEVELMQRQLGEIEARLTGLTVLAPTGGRVVKIHAHAGEQVPSEGILDLADTTKMSVVAEVYATEVATVRPGQQASIEMEDGSGKLQGVVTRVGLEVRQAEVLPNDPVAYSDAHVVPVHIRVPGCRDASCPIDARVKVLIETGR